MSNNVEHPMPYRAVLDAEGLIKLAKAGILEKVISAWNCLVPHSLLLRFSDSPRLTALGSVYYLPAARGQLALGLWPLSSS